MSGKSQQMSTFAIRFNPASVRDDDDELYNFETPTRPRKEILQFERRSASPAPSQDGAANAVDVGVAADATSTDQLQAASHPGTLWKTPQHLARSAPASEASSPVSPMKTNNSSDGEKNSTPGGKDDSQKSIFSELKERIVSQSREILPKRLNKTGSADTAKIVIAPQDDAENFVERETKLKSRSRPGSDAGEALAKEILKAGSTECINSDWGRIEDGEFSVKRSSSTGHLSAKQDASVDSEFQNTGDALAVRSSLTTMTMSELMSLSTSTESLAGTAADANPAKPSTPKMAADRRSGGPASLAVAGRFGHLLSLLKVPGFLKRQSVLAVAVLFSSILLLPLPPFVSGLAVGSFVTAVFAALVYACFLSPAKEKSVPVPRDLKSLPPLLVPEMKESKNTDGLFKGWMNELSEYDVNDYHVNQTHSVFVTLEGSTMRLQTPKQGIAKRAVGDENIPSAVSFVRQKHYDLNGCRVTLLPPDLVEKRLWSKKYPICLEIDKRHLAEPPEKLAKRNSAGKIDTEAPALDHHRSSLKPVASLTKVPAAAAAATTGSAKLLYLFARSTREKEEWFRRFQAAAAATPWPPRMSDLLQKLSPVPTKSHARTGSGTLIELQNIKHGSVDSQSSVLSTESIPPSLEVDYGALPPERNLLEYMVYMAKIMPATEPGLRDAAASVQEQCDPELLWLNAIISRCFLDFLREKYWTNKIRGKIQKKLGKIHVPHFIDQLTVTGIELGPQVPVICRTSRPYLDDRGLWVDLDVSYGGGFCITMETKCNLMKLKSEIPEEKPKSEKRTGALYSDEEDSAESTTDEEGAEENSSDDINADKRSEPISKKLLKFVDKISRSRYFQQATDYRYIKKAMEEVSNTRLILNVEMKAVVGTLAVNIPPPPTNRIWYGFRGNPNLVLSAKPRVGEREVSLSHITDWIEKKLAIEFQRVFVMPNMDDIPIPLMCEHLPASQVSTATS